MNRIDQKIFDKNMVKSRHTKMFVPYSVFAAPLNPSRIYVDVKNLDGTYF